MLSIPRALLGMLLLAFALSAPVCGDSPDFDEMIHNVIRSVESNYSRLPAVRGEIYYLKNNSPELHKSLYEEGPKQEEISIFGDKPKRDEGSILSAAAASPLFPTSIPRSTFISTLSPLKNQFGPFSQRFVILGSDIRVNAFTGTSHVIGLVKGEKLAIYNTTCNNVRIRDRHTKNWQWRDPRNVFSDGSVRLAEFLTEQESGAVSWLKLKQGKLLSLQCGTNDDEIAILKLDPAQNYLPVFVTEFHPYGNTTSEITYQELKTDEGPAWFPSTLIIKSWPLSTPLPKRLETGWRGMREYTIENVTLAPDIEPNEFTLEIPEGTFVDNKLEGSSFYTDGEIRLP